MAHFIRKCRHGRVVTQCRCMSKDKVVEIAPCGAACVADLEQELDDAESLLRAEVDQLRGVIEDMQNDKLRTEDDGADDWPLAKRYGEVCERSRKQAERIADLERENERLRKEVEALEGRQEERGDNFVMLRSHCRNLVECSRCGRVGLEENWPFNCCGEEEE